MIGVIIVLGIYILWVIMGIKTDKNKHASKTIKISEYDYKKLTKEYEEKNNNLKQNVELIQNDFAKKEADLEQKRLKLEEDRKKLEQREQNYEQQLLEKVKSYEKQLFQEKAKSQKWLAAMIADIEVLPINENIEYLFNSYSYTKHDKAIRIEGLKKQIQLLTERNKMLEYELKYIYQLFPKLEDVEIELEDSNKHIDPLEETDWLTKEEWENLSSIEKNTLALERYKNRHKTKWQIGRDFEMFIGYQFEQQGFKVEYHGIEKGLEDLGIDLIAKKGNETRLVQCKYWSTQKTIHENHICQLYGTYVKYKIEHPNENIVPRLFCHNSLSDVAKQFGQLLGVEYFENLPLGDYPAIKACDRDEKIYHLPFDLGYDEIKHCIKFMTVEEAEKAGYRRTYKWHRN